MADADLPGWFTGDGLYSIRVTSLVFAEGDDAIPPEKQIPFNLESVVVSGQAGLQIHPRVLHGRVFDSRYVADGARLNTTYTKFVLADSDDPNAVLASVPFIVITTFHLGRGVPEHRMIWETVIRMRRDAMTTRFLLNTMPPDITRSLLGQRMFDGVDWYTGAGVYKITYSAAFRNERLVDETEADIEYNQYAAVFDPELPHAAAAGELRRVLMLFSRLDPIHVIFQHGDNGQLKRYVESAEKTDYDVSWFLLDPAPPINKSRVFPLHDWDDFAQMLPAVPQDQVLRYHDNVLRDNTYTRYIHRRLRLDIVPDDTPSLWFASWRKHTTPFRRGGEDTVGDKEEYRRTLPPRFQRALDQHTSVRMYT